MKTNLKNLSLVAFVALGLFSCKNNEKETEQEMAAAAEASELSHEYVVDIDESIIKWEGSKPTATHYGTVKLASGTLHEHEGKIEAGNFVIDMNTIVDEDLEGDYKNSLEAHLKGTVEGKEGDFFNVTEYPNATFELTGIENDVISGNLTIKDKTNPIQFPAKITMNGDELTIVSDPIELDRTKWGVNFNSKSIFPNIGDKVISDTIKITVNLRAKKKDNV